MMQRDIDEERLTLRATFGPESPFVLRPMEEGDVPAVMAIERRSFPSPWPESAYRYELSFRSDSFFYVLQPREETPSTRRDRLLRRMLQVGRSQMLGYVGFRLRGVDAHICTIAVHPDWRGLGLGELLLLAALGKALTYAVQHVTLEVRPSNRAARRLYARLGFVRTGVRQAYYRNGEDAWFMKLGPLDGATVGHLGKRQRAIETRLAGLFVYAAGRQRRV
jgi:ribosomal-protein-alanine N-acetyltransferase